MGMFSNSGNPALQDRIWDRVGEGEERSHMTVEGTANKVVFLLFLVVVAGAFGWNLAEAVGFQANLGWTLASAGGAFALSLVIGFNPQLAKPLGWLFALVEGFLLGSISVLLNQKYPGIALQAAGLTATIALAMFGIYRTGVTRKYPMFWKIVIGMTMGIMLLYAVQMVAVLAFGWSFPFIHDTGAVGIGFSLFVSALAALNLSLDYHVIEEGERRKAPKDMEWYGAWGLTVTLCWVYFEMLRLLSKLRR